MREGYAIRDQFKPHFVTFTVTDWVDVFTRKEYADVIIDSMKYCQKSKGLILFSYVIMSNHIHAIMQSANGELSNLIRDFRRFTSKNIIDLIIKNNSESRQDWMLKRFEFAGKSVTPNQDYKFWREGFHPEEIFSEKFMWSKLNYIHLNPVRSRIVNKASNYIYSSASNYVNGKGEIEVELVSNVLANSTDWKIFLNDW